jgi:cell surface protein SprA
LKIVQTVLLSCFLLLFGSELAAQVKAALKVPFADSVINKGKDTVKKKYGKDTVHFPIRDKRGDFLSDPSNNPFELHDTSVLKRRVEYNPASKSYYISEMVAGKPQRIPATLTFDEFWKLKTNKDEEAYFRQRANSLGTLNRKMTRPKAKVYDSYFDRLFGKTGSDLKVDIRPVGEINIRAGYQGQNVANPTLPEAARKNGGFDFDANTNFSMNASIGDKLKIPINLNSLSNLGFDNQLRLNYRGKKDEIIKSIDAGNINFISRSTLIPSTQNLFGVISQLQFGRLFVTAAIANQKSQRQSMNLQGGTSTQHFQKRLDDYEENRHFLLSQYFRNNYNTAMSNLPVVNSQAQIKRIEVWVTNRNGQTTNARDIVGLSDLGEARPSKKSIETNPGNVYPDNGANSLFSSIINNPKSRNPSDVSTILTQDLQLRSSEDYERTFARKLTENEYFFNPQIGFLSLNIPLQPDEVLAVAFQYTYNGKVFQVGEFSNDIALNPNNGVQQIMFLKLLKATTQRTDLPIWNLMMKNVYSLDLFGTIQPTDFQLNVLYEDPSLGQKRYLPVTDDNDSVKGKALIKILKLDRLNNRNDPQPDGVFDYVEGFTVLSKMGRIVFPVLEPFGDDLKEIAFKKLFLKDSALVKKYLFPQLYRNIKADAQTYTNLNRFIMEGQVKGAGGTSEISLNAFNVPQGSVSVRAGGQILKEGTDYIVDYGSGTVRIINPGILSSNIPVNVSFENNLGFGFQERAFRALRLDYVASKNFNLGFSSQRLSERPFFTKTNFGSDPIKNAMYGLDFNYKGELPSVTRALNKLPFYKTKAKSYITAYGEAAYLQPGHAQQIGKGASGLVYLDDFESARTNIDLRFPFTSWALASTPYRDVKDKSLTTFDEARLTDSVDYNKRRARIAWYTIEPTLQDRNSSNNPLSNNLPVLSDPRVRQVFTNELFPNKTTNITDIQLPTFDLTYYPKERGPYNYNFKELNTKGQFGDPTDKWGGIMRALDQTDFETNVIEYVEFWVQNPFIKSPATSGQLVLNLGNVSEDILRDGRRFYENGMPTPNIPASVDSSTWGRVPTNPIQITNAFSNNPDDRKFQDIGFDGLDDAAERLQRKEVIDQISNSTVKQQFLNDPSADNYKWYRDDSYTAANAGILDRYKYFNNPQGNSPVAGTSVFSSAATMLPDNEDLNRDNTLNESESYWEYIIDLKKGNLGVGSNYITDSRQVPVTYADGTQGKEDWYLFRIPIRDPKRKSIGGIADFRSIRFMRMYMTGFEDSITMRFAKLDLVRNQWRQYIYDIDGTGNYKAVAYDNTTINTLAVSIEQNGSRQPIKYVIPPGIERVQLLSNNGVNLLQNEQALSVQLNNLKKASPRGVFKTMNIDIRRYGNLSMFLHAETQKPNKLKGDITAVIRMGQDFQNNFYEIRIPLKETPSGAEQADLVWPAENSLNLSLNDLVNLKLDRDKINYSYTKIFPKEIKSGINTGQIYSVMGNPNLGEIKGILIAFENTSSQSTINAEVWVNELRLSEMDESGSYAALGRMDMILADLGNVSLSMNKRTAGFGTIEQNMNQRVRTGVTQFDIATNIEAGKLLPKQVKISIPVLAS